MEQYVIKGGNPLVGEVDIAGAKNAALAILSAAIMTDETILIENLPDVRDAGRARADDGRLDAVAFDTAERQVLAVDDHPVGEEPLEHADGHRGVLCTRTG